MQTRECTRAERINDLRPVKDSISFEASWANSRADRRGGRDRHQYLRRLILRFHHVSGVLLLRRTRRRRDRASERCLASLARQSTLLAGLAFKERYRRWSGLPRFRADSGPRSDAKYDSQKDDADQPTDEDQATPARPQDNFTSAGILRRDPVRFSFRLLLVHELLSRRREAGP